MQLLKGFEGKKIQVELNGHLIPCIMSISWEYELEMPRAGYDFDFGNVDANSEYETRFDKNELVSIYVQVSVHGEGLEALDSLGACHIEVSDFETNVLNTVLDHDMVSNAKNDLTKQILELAKRFPKYLVKAV